jgi:ubiquinone biosynthesis protein UbiJ
MSLLFSAISAAIQAAANRAVALDPQTKQRLQTMSGRVLAVHFTDIKLTLFILPTQDGLSLYQQYDGDVDTELRGSTLSLLGMSFSRQPADTLMKGDVQIRGDTELGRRFQSVLRDFDLDWEERLSILTGDTLAHKVGNVARGLVAWGGHAKRSFESNLSEYLQYETRVLPAAQQVKQFVDGVDTLRDEVERLQARITRLQANADKSGRGAGASQETSALSGSSNQSVRKSASTKKRANKKKRQPGKT